MNYVWCPNCRSRHTSRQGYGCWRCDECGHGFEHWDSRDQFQRDLEFGEAVVCEEMT